jgi:hypothetical protein
MARKPRAEFEITAQDKSAAELRQAEKRLQAIAGNVKSFGLAAGAAMAGLGVAVVKITSDIDKLAKTAKSANVGVETFQAWEFAANQSGVATEQFRAALTRANTAIGQAAAGTGPAARAFADLGISVRDVSGNIRSTEDVVRDLADRFTKIKTPAEQAAFASAVFGREAGPRMALLLNQGNEALNRYEAQLRAAGGIVTEKAAANAERLNDKMDEFRRIMSAQLANAILENADALEDLAGSMGSVAAAAVSGFAAVSGYFKFLGQKLGAAGSGVPLSLLLTDVESLGRAIEDQTAKIDILKARFQGNKSLVQKSNGELTPIGAELQANIEAAEAELVALRAALERAQENRARPPRSGGAAGGAGASGVDDLLQAADAELAAVAKAEEQKIRLKMQFARELSASIESELRERAERELQIWQEQLAQAAGFEDVAAQEAFQRDEQLFLAKMEARARQFEEELAVELGYKDARDRIIQEAEEAHQQTLLEIRTREFGTFQRLAMDLAKFEQKTASEKTQFILQQAAQLTAGLATNSKALFNINKGVAIANATMNTAEGVTKALAQMNFGLAALIAVTGAAQIATIASTQFGGAASGLTSRGPGTGIPSMAGDMFNAPVVSESERNKSTIRLVIQADDSDIARAIFRQARQVADDEDDLLFSQSSRQAIEIG